MTAGSLSPAILYIFGIMSKSPWLQVNVVERAPDKRAPCKAPETPASDCISTVVTCSLKTFFSPLFAFAVQYSAMAVEGVIG